jgi:phenylacetate-CoA ligase
MSEPGKVPVARRVAFSAQVLVRSLTEPRMASRSWAAIERAQRRRVRRTIAHAIKHVPHYREACRKLGLGPGDFQGAADLAKLPLIEREHLQRDPEYFVSEARPLESYIELRSGGSTGAPISIFLGPRDLVDRSCIRTRALNAAARAIPNSGRPRVVSIISPLGNGARLRRATRRVLFAPLDPRQIQLQIPIDTDPADALTAINEFRPDVVGSFGSYIEALFTHAVRSGQPFHRPKLVMYAGDPISPSARRMLLEDLGIEVLSGYGAVEAPLIGFECLRHRGFHLNVDVWPVRIVDADGRELPLGESGDVVISDLANRATVLLNYRLGDVAAAIPEPCDCGLTLPLLTDLQGRSDEWVEGHDRRPIHPQLITVSISRDDEVWGYQVTQLAPGRFTALVLPASGADGEAIRARVSKRFASTVGPDEIVEISLVDSLPRTPGGKVRRIVRAGGSGGTGTP